MAQLKVKQISDFISAVGGIHDATVGAAAVTAIAGVQSDVDANTEAIALNTAKAANVTTDLAVTESTTTNIVTSSDGTDATLTAATTLKAGLMTKAMFDEHVANNGKVGITTDQADAIAANTTKKGITSEQSTAIVDNTAKVGITPEQAEAIVANTDNIATEKGRIDTLLAGSSAALNTFKEIETFITGLSTADVTVIEAISTAVSNDVVHARDISTNSTAIAANTTAIANLELDIDNLDFTVNLSKEADATSNTVVNSAGTDAKLSGATEEVAGLMTADDFRKLSGIQDGADVTDATSVAAAGALMTEDITNLDEVKAFSSSDYATADQGALAESALQDANAFDVKGAAAAAQSAAEATAAADATSKADAAETAANGYTNTRETSILSTLRGEISAVAGVDKVEQIATFASITEFSVTRALSLDNNDILVFVNGLQIHQSGEGIDGFATANGREFVVSGLGYNLDENDHIVVVGVAAAE